MLSRQRNSSKPYRSTWQLLHVKFSRDVLMRHPPFQHSDFAAVHSSALSNEAKRIYANPHHTCVYITLYPVVRQESSPGASTLGGQAAGRRVLGSSGAEQPATALLLQAVPGSPLDGGRAQEGVQGAGCSAQGRQRQLAVLMCDFADADQVRVTTSTGEHMALCLLFGSLCGAVLCCGFTEDTQINV